VVIYDKEGVVPTRTLVDWITDPNTCFLLGAGCSASDGKPLMSDLTASIAEGLSGPCSAALASLKGTYGRRPTIEDLLNFLLRTHQLLSSQLKPPKEGWTLDSVEKEIGQIESAIVRVFGSGWEPSPTYGGFLRRLASAGGSAACDIFTLNYDTLLEATLDDLKYGYVDGFRGGENAYFDPSTFEEIPDGRRVFRVFKLHGSVNWTRDEDQTVRRRPLKSLDAQTRIVVYPAEQKYIQTQYGVYERLLGHFRDRLRDNRQNNKLIVIGYSFGDEHINLAIEDSILTPGTNLTVFAFVGPEDDREAQEKRLADMARRCDHRFNAFIGDYACVGPALEDEMAQRMLALDAWKFEELVAVMTGGEA
jgi:SIR2-like domain